MATKYASHVSTKKTPANEKIPGSNQVENSAGGYVYQVGDDVQLERFLVLGSTGGTFYVGERKLTQENAEVVIRCLKSNGKETVEKIVAVSESGRAPKQDPTIFALALAATHGDDDTKRAAFAAVSRVCRIGTHLFQFAAACDELRGWGRGLKRAVADWYTEKTADALAYQVGKYQQRDGWSHRDLLRLSHPKTADPQKQAVLRWATRGAEGLGEVKTKRGETETVYAATGSLPRFLEGFEKAKWATTATEIAALIRDYNLPRECVPTPFLTEAAVWEALLERMPLTALIRNLSNLTKCGVVAPLSNGTRKVVDFLGNNDNLKKARVHPFSLLVALKTYASGRGVKGNATWTPVPAVIDALDEAFYAAFDAVVPTGKRWLVAVDCSGSMDSENIAGLTGISARVAAAAMALVIAGTEKQSHIVGFSSPTGQCVWGQAGGRFGGGDPALTPLSISRRQRLDDVIKTTQAVPGGGTDCSVPMRWAEKNKIEVDAFLTVTDNETWCGPVHPSQALKSYRQKTGLAAKSIVMGMTATSFSIADPTDAGSLDVVGMDTAVPNLVADFVRDPSEAKQPTPNTPDNDNSNNGGQCE